MMPLLLDHLWQSTLSTALAGFLTLAFTRNSAAIRYWLWFAASVKFLVPFSLLTGLGAFLFQTFARPVPLPILSGFKPAAMPFSDAAPVLSTAPGFDWALWLLVVWGAGSAALLLLWMARVLRLRAVVRAAKPLAIAAPLPVKSSLARLEPGLVGIWRPVLLLPEGIATHLTQPEMNAILAHELCHLRRRDNLLAAIHMLVEALFWFHPLVWWLGTRLIAERENACDEAVLASGNNPQTYAEGILKVCQFYLHSPLACASGVSGADLKKRMETIMENKITLRLGRMKKSLLATAAIAVVAAPLAFGLLTTPPAIAPASAQATGTPHPGTQAALRRQIEALIRKQPLVAEQTPGLAALTRRQQADIEKEITAAGALQSITFKGVEDNWDVYGVQFADAYYIWTVAPLTADGKVAGMAFDKSALRADNGPSPGLEAAIRRELAGSLEGKPAYEIMSPGLQDVARKDLAPMSADIRSLGAVRAITFQKVDAKGWDVYHVTFANGSETVKSMPLVDGKLDKLIHTDVLANAPQHPGTEAALRRYIDMMEKGQPDYSQMVPEMAKVEKEQAAYSISFFKKAGNLKSLTFQGRGNHSSDVYKTVFENAATSIFVAPLSADGKMVLVFFNPDRKPM